MNNINNKHQTFIRLLVQLRINAGYSSSFEASREMGAGRNTVYRYEKGTSIPTFAMLNSLMNLYNLQKNDRSKLITLREELLNKESR